MPAKARKRHVIAQLRRELGATQPQFARRLGISLTTIQKIEGGRMAVSARTAYAMSYQTGIARRYFLHNELPRNLDMVAVKEHYKKLRIAMVPMSEQFYNWQHLTPRANLFRLLVLHLAIAQELGEAGCESSGFYKILERNSESLLRCIGDAYLRRGIYNKAAAIAKQGLGAVLNSVQGEIKGLRQAIKDKEQRESSKAQENDGK